MLVFLIWNEQLQYSFQCPTVFYSELWWPEFNNLKSLRIKRNEINLGWRPRSAIYPDIVTAQHGRQVSLITISLYIFEFIRIIVIQVGASRAEEHKTFNIEKKPISVINFYV